MQIWDGDEKFCNDPWLGINCCLFVLFFAQVWGVEPDYTREGGSIPVTLTFQDVTGKNVMLLPIGSADDGAHSQNEKINIKNYIQGTKVFVEYIYQLAQNCTK